MKIHYKHIKKTIFALLLLAFVSSCTDNDVEPLFDQTVNERSDALKAQYLDVLTAPENGWIANYTPNKDFGVYTMLMNFNADGSVTINSDYNRGVDNNTITYRLDKTLKIELVLESFAVFHRIFEINNNNNQGEFVFNVLSATEDEVTLESKLDFGDDITVFKLRKAQPEDLDVNEIFASEEQLAGMPQDSGLRNILLNGAEIGVFGFNPADRTATITYTNADNEEISETVRIAITKDGFFFFDPVSINGTELNTFMFDAINSGYTDTANSNLVIDDFLVCPFDINQFVGTYSANEEGYCDGCYEVEVTYNSDFDVLILSNLYDFGGAAVVQLNETVTPTNPKVDFVSADFDIAVQVNADFGNVWATNPGDISGNPDDNISTFNTCNQYMDLYFSRCVAAGCFPGQVHVELTKLP